MCLERYLATRGGKGVHGKAGAGGGSWTSLVVLTDTHACAHTHAHALTHTYNQVRYRPKFHILSNIKNNCMLATGCVYLVRLAVVVREGRLGTCGGSEEGGREGGWRVLGAEGTRQVLGNEGFSLARRENRMKWEEKEAEWKQF